MTSACSGGRCGRLSDVGLALEGKVRKRMRERPLFNGASGQLMGPQAAEQSQG